MKAFSLSAILHLTLLMVSICFAWMLLSFANFGYSFWFDALEIHEFIEKNAPLNRYKEGFELLSKADYSQLFLSINKAIHSSGQGLDKISYTYINAQGSTITTQLLRQPEITHLKDVAWLINIVKITGTFSILVLGFCWYFKLIKGAMLSRKNMLIKCLYFWICLAIFSAIVFIFKPIAFFYWLHELIFPENHQWFFYYQDSLMTTLMKAPFIFGPISLCLLGLILILHVTLIFLMTYLKRSPI